MNNSLIVFTSESHLQIHFAKNKLEEEGIQCFVKDENIVQIVPLYGIALGGIKLMVEQQDVERALIILQENEFIPILETKPTLENKFNYFLKEHVFDSEGNVKSNIRSYFITALMLLLFVTIYLSNKNEK
jgi:hypothetical protein